MTNIFLSQIFVFKLVTFNPLNAELNPICHLPALLGTNLIFHVSRLRVKHVGGHRGLAHSRGQVYRIYATSL